MDKMNKCKCSVCGAILPESLVCEYCGADNSPEFKAKFDDKGMGIIEWNGEKIKCFIESVDVDTLCSSDVARTYDGKMIRVPVMRKRTFTIKEL